MKNIKTHVILETAIYMFVIVTKSPQKYNINKTDVTYNKYLKINLIITASINTFNITVYILTI